jgi:riboflavin synthase
LFTGIVEDVGRVVESREREGVRTLSLEAGRAAAELRVGSSVAVSGVCLTVTSLTGSCFTVDVASETLHRTTLGRLGKESRVNLELPVRPEGRLDGHVVQGHVDGRGRIARVSQRESDRVLRIEHPAENDVYLVEKGSIAIDGVSLTVTACEAGGFEVMLIPYTLRVTTLGERVAGDEVNLEYDILAKYLVRLTELRRVPWKAN